MPKLPAAFLNATAFLGFILGAPSVAGAQAPPWWDTNYPYRKTITIAASQVAGPLTDFPALVRLPSDADLAADAQDDGDDIAFTASDGVTKLDHEIETFNGATGELVAWVRVPSLSDTTNTVLYMYYGNPAAASQQAVPGTWDAGFRGVWHLKENPSGAAPQMNDSTANANGGTSAGGMTTADQVAGQVDGSLDFDGTDDSIGMPPSASLNIAGAITLEAWVNLNVPRTSLNPAARVISKWWGSNGGYVLYFGSGNDLVFSTADGAAQDGIWFPVPVNQGQWYYLAATWSPGPGGQKALYVNGALLWSGASTNAAINPSGAVAELAGAEANPGNYLNARMDEVRISSAARSASYVTTTFNNLNSPSSFFTLGPEENVGGGPPPPPPGPSTGRDNPNGNDGINDACWGGSSIAAGPAEPPWISALAGLAMLFLVSRRPFREGRGSCRTISRSGNEK